MRCLFVTVFNPVLLKLKVSKGLRKKVEVLVPDFCVGTFAFLVPCQVQMIRQPMRDDLMLSSEQRDFVNAMCQSGSKLQRDNQHISQVSLNFVLTPMDDYHKIMQRFEQLQNYLLAISEADEQLLSAEMMQRLQDLFRMLPTKDFEFNFLADLCMFTNQILQVAGNLNKGKQVESLVSSVCSGLKFHMLPFLYEVGMSGLDSDSS